MLRGTCGVLVLGLLTTFVPVSSADGPLICWGQISLDCGIPNDPCDILGEEGSDLKNLCGIGWFGCQLDLRYCVIDPIKSCGYDGDSCILP